MTEQQQDVKLLVVDIDGTLLNSKHQLTDRTASAIQTVAEAGIQVVLATGKPRIGAAELLARLNLQTPGIFLQGLAVHASDGSVLYQQTLDPALSRRIITYAEAAGFAMAAYTTSRILVKTPNQRITDGVMSFHEPEPEAVGPLQNILDGQPINKLVAIGDTRQIKRLRWQLNAQFNGSCKLMSSANIEALEILPPGASKGASLRVLLKDLDITPNQVVAIGDGENDIEMLQLAGFAVAVGNADEAVKNVADEIVASNDEDGVVDAIERFVIKRKLDENPDAAPTAKQPTPEATNTLEAAAPDSDAKPDATDDKPNAESDKETADAPTAEKGETDA